MNELELPPQNPVKLPPPCPICGEQEKEVSPGLYRITHKYDVHGFPPSAADRGNAKL